MLRDARQRVAEANDMAAAELAGRISAQEQGRAMLEKASFAHENGESLNLFRTHHAHAIAIAGTEGHARKPAGLRMQLS